MANKIKDGTLNPSLIDEKLIDENLDTAGIPDPDLIIRTSGEQRISNFLLWQMAYTEMYFSEVFWPDFSEQELDKAIESFNGRHRRFGGIKGDKNEK
ncbi:MAG: UDP pyrophosphate synthetase [Sphingobacteriia bacterium]|nr:UDP pyrophosphate synthetase [Sphingobacteriia bacterium]